MEKPQLRAYGDLDAPKLQDNLGERRFLSHGSAEMSTERNTSPGLSTSTFPSNADPAGLWEPPAPSLMHQHLAQERSPTP